MTRIRALSGVAALALLAGLGLGATPSAAQGRDMKANEMRRGDTRGDQDRMHTASRRHVTVEMLYDRLEPEGEFVEIRGLGRAWKPADVATGWRPYTHGHWIFNRRVGWYFSSAEPWAEITYHYGRWYEDPDEGWVWIADTEWAPAWVEWRRSRSHVGWRPLPPRNAPRVARARGRTEVVEQWVFVPADRITEERITTVIIEEEPRLRTIYREARPVGRVERRGGVTVNFGLDPEVLRRESNVTIESRNLPRVEAAPVPQEVEQISTEARTTTTTTTGPERTRRPGEGDRDASRSRETLPGEQPAGTATAPARREQREPSADSARQPAAEPGTTGTRTGADERRQRLERQRRDSTQGPAGQDAETARERDRANRPAVDNADRDDDATPDKRRRRATTGATEPASRQDGAKASETRTRDEREPARPSARRPGPDEQRGASSGTSEPPAAARGSGDARDPSMRRPPAGQAGRDRGPTPGQAGARSDETTGSVRQPRHAPDAKRDGGEAKGSGRERGPKRWLPPGGAGASD